MGDRLVLATLSGSDQTVVRDLGDLAQARTICTLGKVAQPRFVNGQTVSYWQPGAIVRVDLTSGKTDKVAETSATTVYPYSFAWSLDGSALSYVDITDAGGAWYRASWHLVTSTGNRRLATLPPFGGRGGSVQDDQYLGFSADGRYVAIETTVAVGGTGERAPLQVRRVDGTLAYSRDHASMAVWAGNALYFRDGSQLYRWSPDGLTQLTLSPAGGFGDWFRPRTSPDGSRIVFYWLDSGWIAHVGVLDLARGVATPAGPAGRWEPVFANQNNIWYLGETACNTCLGSVNSTGKAYLFDIAGQTEASSKITRLIDTWSRST